MSHLKVVRIRPVSWKLFVQGEAEARDLRELLRGHRFETSAIAREPDLVEPSIYAFNATPCDGTTMTSAELQLVLQQHAQVEPMFDVLSDAS